MSRTTVWRRFAALLLCSAIVGPAAAQQRDALELFRQGRYQDAVNVTTGELAEDPRNMDAYTVIGWSLNALGRYGESLEYGDRALQVSPFDVRVIANVADATYNLGALDRALSLAERYVALAPTGNRIADMYYLMAEVLYRYNELHHAEIALVAALRYRPRVAAWWLRLGGLREELADAAGAGAAFRQALTIAPTLPAALEGLQRVQQ